MARNTIKICALTLLLHTLRITAQASGTTSSPVSRGDASSVTSAIEKQTADDTAVPEETTIAPPKTPGKPVEKAAGCNGTCIHFNASADAYTLEKAMEGFGSDKFTIVDLLAWRTNAQRQDIRRAYKENYQEELIKQLKSELSGNLAAAIEDMLLPNHEFYAKELRDSFAGLGTDDTTVAEILGALSSSEVENIAAVYSKVYGTPLKDDVIFETSGPLQTLLVGMCETYRRLPKDGKVNTSAAEEATHKLILAGFDTELKNTDDEEKYLIHLFTTQSFPMLKIILSKYNELMRVQIADVIAKRYSGSLKHAFLAIVNRVTSKSTYYANLLEQSMAGIGTDNRRLIRIIVGRSEIDLDHIIKTYERIYKIPLVDRVADDTSGDFKNLLLALIRKDSK